MNDNLTNKEIQDELLTLFKKTIEFLKENNIKYFASSGTCLGAVRHQGFIPWDNDIDIFLFRDEYIKLKKLLENSNLEYLDFEKDEFYPYPYIKIVNKDIIIKEHIVKKSFSNTYLYIDIFPCDYLPDDIKERKKTLLKQKLLLGIFKIKYFKNKKKGWLIHILSCFLSFFTLFISKKYINQRLNNLGVKYVTNSCMDLCWGKTPLKTSFFSKTMDVKFENMIISIPYDYHEYLHTIYGDYMKLPPIEKREVHDFDAYRK